MVAVYAFIQDASGQVCFPIVWLHQQHGGRLGASGGSAESGEPVAHALVREPHEELAGWLTKLTWRWTLLVVIRFA